MLTIWKALPKRHKRRLANWWYEAISRVDTGDDLTFMNHGFAPLEGKPEIIELPPGLEKHRFPIQHYYQLAVAVEWQGREAVEVSSGRGGGAAYLFDTFHPARMLGVDLAPSAVAYSNDNYVTGRQGLEFRVGDAQNLPLPDASCDILINVESSLNYPDQAQFLAEVDRVLRPGGYLLLADYRSAKGMRKLEARLAALGYETVAMSDISSEIVRALELGDARKRDMLKRRVPAPLRGLVGAFAFAGKAADAEIARFRNGEKRYLRAVLRKPPAQPEQLSSMQI